MSIDLSEETEELHQTIQDLMQEITQHKQRIAELEELRIQAALNHEAIVNFIHTTYQEKFENLSEVTQEPVAWMCADEDMVHRGYSRFSRVCQGDWNIPVYTTPQISKSLTDDEIFELADTSLYEGGKNFGILQFARAIEKKVRGEV